MHTNLFITRSCMNGDRDKSNAEYLQRKNDVWAPTQTKLHGLKIRAHSDPKLKKRIFFYPISVAAAASSPTLSDSLPQDKCESDCFDHRSADEHPAEAASNPKGCLETAPRKVKQRRTLKNTRCIKKLLALSFLAFLLPFPPTISPSRLLSLSISPVG